MVDYIFCKNLKKKDLIEELKEFYRSNFILTEYEVLSQEDKIRFQGLVRSDTSKTEFFRDIEITGSLDAKTIRWIESDWGRKYEVPSAHLVKKVQNQVADDLKKHYSERGYATIDDFASVHSPK